jgi:hypothetical protein
MRVPLYSAASTTSTPADMPLMIRLRMGKFCGAGKVPTGNSEIRAPREPRSADGDGFFPWQRWRRDATR